MLKIHADSLTIQQTGRKTYTLLSTSPTVCIEVLLYCCSLEIYMPITTENEGSPQCFQGARL